MWHMGKKHKKQQKFEQTNKTDFVISRWLSWRERHRRHTKVCARSSDPRSHKFQDMVDIVCELFEAAFHLILYVRQVYPPSACAVFGCLFLKPFAAIFERVQKFGVPVHQARHPDVQRYLADAVLALRPWLQHRTLQKVVLSVCDDAMAPLERFVFDVTPVDRAAALSFDNLQAYLRSFLLKISTAEAAMAPNARGTTFAVQAYTREDAFLSPQGTRAHPSAAQTMLLEETMQAWEPVDAAAVAPPHRRVVPLKSMPVGPMRLELVVEQAGAATEDDFMRS